MKLTTGQKVGATIAGLGALFVLFGRKAEARAPAPPAPTPPTPTPTRRTSPSRTVPSDSGATVSLIIPLQDPRTSLVNTNDPVKDRAVREVLGVQLDAIGAPANPDTLIRATSWLASHGSPAPLLTTQADVLYWAARKINTYVEQSFYGSNFA